MNKTSSWGLIKRDNSYLFIQRSKKTSRPNQWCPPGGSKHLGETPEEACIREVKEEVGLIIEIDQLITQSGSFYYFLCKELIKNQTITLKENECSDYRWIILDDLLELGQIMELTRMRKVLSTLKNNEKLMSG